MPLVTKQTAAVSKEVPVVPVIAEPTYKGITVDNSITPRENLLVHIAGSAWIVNYYSQVINANVNTEGQNVTMDPVYQQYTKIHDYEMRVNSPLSYSQDNVTKVSTYTGSATLYPGLKPNRGDMFIADMGDGSAGLFTVISTEKMSYFKDATYKVDYTLVSPVTPDRVADLDNKAVKTVWFKKEQIEQGGTPFLVRDEAESLSRLKSDYKSLIGTYYKEFFNKEFSTLIVPGQSVSVYDHHLVRFCSSLFNSDDAQEIRHTRIFGDELNDHLSVVTPYDAIIKRDKSLLEVANRRMGKLPSKKLNADVSMHSVRYSGIKQVVYPYGKSVVGDTKSPSDFIPATLEAFVTVPSRGGDLAGVFMPDPDDIAPFASLPIMSRIASLNTYLFDDDFYNGTPKDKLFDLEIGKYLRSEPLDVKVLRKMSSSYNRWGALERFYYLPILLCLIKYTIKNL